MFNIWQDIGLMTWLTRIVMRVALALLILAGAVWLLKRPYFAINQFRFVGDVQQMDESKLRGMMNKHLVDGFNGGFFSMELQEVQASLKDIGWVKSSSVRRVWPHEIEVTVEAYQPVAVWDKQYLSIDGDVFDMQLSGDARAKLLVTQGPAEASKLVATQISVFADWLKPLGTLHGLTLSSRYSWSAVLDNGLLVEFGRADTPTVLAERAARLAQSSKFIKDNMDTGSGAYIDLRYPNGFAMKTDKLHRVADAAEVKQQVVTK